jgi:glycosyltransferase involved in cell wall biosynthesis
MMNRNCSSPVISVVVPCRNEKELTEDCICSILAQEAVPGALEVIVADGMSDDGTREIVARITKNEPRIRVVDNPGRIVSTGLNAAIRAARGQVIIRMDVHTRYARDYVQSCVTTLRHTGAENVGGPARTESSDYIQSAICAAYHSRFAVGGARFHDIDYEGYVDTVTYGCWPREVFERIGLFDEELVRNQDDEFNLRLTRAGGKIWQSPKIRSWYRPRPSLSALFRQYMQYGYWKVRVIQKHRIPASWRHLVPGMFVFAASILALFAPWSSVAARAWLTVIGLYLLCDVAASVITSVGCGWRLFPVLPVVFACYHFSYGYGFLRGLVDFIVLRRKPAAQFTQLTRSSAKPHTYGV